MDGGDRDRPTMPWCLFVVIEEFVKALVEYGCQAMTDFVGPLSIVEDCSRHRSYNRSFKWG